MSKVMLNSRIYKKSYIVDFISKFQNYESLDWIKS